MKFSKLFIIFLLCFRVQSQSDDLKDLELLEADDINILLEEENLDSDLDLSRLEEIDELESLKEDVGQTIPNTNLSKENQDKLDALKRLDDQGDLKPLVDEKSEIEGDIESLSTKEENTKPTVFDVGNEEKQLLELAKFVEKKIPDDEWNEIATNSAVTQYVVQEGDWLWKISKEIFGSGFYYSKIWSMNPQITNPHEIEPGQVLVFDTGDSSALPNVSVSTFDDKSNKYGTDPLKQIEKANKFAQYGENISSNWLKERERLKKQGIYFQYMTDDEYSDILDLDSSQLNEEHLKYDPPISEALIQEPSSNYDSSGFDTASKFQFKIKEGFYLNTFLSTNFVQDLGFIKSKQDESIYIKKHENVYINFDSSIKVRPGDKFSAYYPQGKVSHKISDREGHKYTIVGQLEIVRQIDDVWEAKVTEISGLVERGARITVYTPKIKKIFKSFNTRLVEAAVIDTYEHGLSNFTLGDVVYLDRGRVDGVELGNVFQVYGFIDRGTSKKIANNPAYTNGELVVISLTDNFATALVTYAQNEMKVGNIALAKTKESAMRDARAKQGIKTQEEELKSKLNLEELDVELDLDDISSDLLDSLDKVELQEDELEELERQEREKSIINESEDDLKEIEKIERELIDAESKLNERKIDEDEYLEKQDLEALEKNQKKLDPNALETVDEFEVNNGKKYAEQDMNSKENPYGLTEFDLEEIDELLNTESK